MRSDLHGPPDARRRTAAVVAVAVAVAGCATAHLPAVDRSPRERAGAPPATAVVASTDAVEPAFASLHDDAGRGFAAGARLVDTSTGQSTAIRGLVYQSSHRRLDASVRAGGALERLEMAKATRALGERMVESFLLAAGEASGQGTVAATKIACGIEPVRPVGTWTWSMSVARRPEAGQDDGHLFQHPATGVADSARPLLAWKARPAVPDDGRTLAWARAAGVRQDLRIWNQVDGAPGEPVYERFGLAATEYCVEAALAPGSRYFWSIRMRYTIDGRARSSRWGATNVPSFDLLAALRPLVYKAGMEAGSVVPRACGATDWIACGCLDFIPPRSLHSFATP